jgi:hypothetical protein
LQFRSFMLCSLEHSSFIMSVTDEFDLVFDSTLGALSPIDEIDSMK